MFPVLSLPPVRSPPYTSLQVLVPPACHPSQSLRARVWRRTAAGRPGPGAAQASKWSSCSPCGPMNPAPPPACCPPRVMLTLQPKFQVRGPGPRHSVPVGSPRRRPAPSFKFRVGLGARVSTVTASDYGLGKATCALTVERQQESANDRDRPPGQHTADSDSYCRLRRPGPAGPRP
jgi:hypothetical protein